MRDSLSGIEPWARSRWLTQRGLQDYYRANSWEPKDDSGLVCVGRWSYGPSVKVSLRVTEDDTIVCLARGSGASIIRFRSRDSLTLDLLSDINCSGIVSRAIIRDTLVYCGMDQGGTGIEVWGVSDLTDPHRLSYTYLPPVQDIAVRDSFLYTTSYSGDSFRVFSVADPTNPVQLGACSDSGTMMCASGDHCYLGGQYGLFIMDVSNPANPYRVGTIGGDVISVAVRDTLCYSGTTEFALRVYNVQNPAVPISVGTLSGIEASDIYLPPTCDTVLYTPKLHVINIADPAHPRQVGFVDCPGWDYGVAAVPALTYALVADYFDGLVAVDLANPTTPGIDTLVYSAGTTEDIVVDGTCAYLAQYHSGMRILDVTTPALPTLLGCADTIGVLPRSHAIVARDSFVYLGWTAVPYLRAFDVSDPLRPTMHGGCDITNPPQGMVLEDPLIYVAEIARFQVVNVARPREPVLVGSCNAQDGVWGLAVQDTLAYIAGVSLYIVNIADPKNPVVVNTSGKPSIGVAVRDTLVYVPSVETLYVYSAADPLQLRVLSTTPTGRAWDVVLGDSLLYIGTTEGVEAYDISNPVEPRKVADAVAPYSNRRLWYSGGYLYSAIWDAGVAIYETTATGVLEQRLPERPRHARLRVVPSVAGSRVRLEGTAKVLRLSVYDATGRAVVVEPTARKEGDVELNVAGLVPGIYFVKLVASRGVEVLRFAKP